MPNTTVPSDGGNRLLAALPPRVRRWLADDLKAAVLNHGEVLFEAGEPIQSVYFPDGGLVSILVPVESEKVAEVAVVGREGMVGLPVFLGADIHPHRAIVQAPGPALRVSAKAFRAAARRSSVLSELLLQYTDAFLVQVSQSAVCNCLHSVPKRYTRWLLMAHDRLGSDRLPLTLKFLAFMLTVRLASVSEATSALERAGLIRYRRGELHILDRPGLEAASCSCYRLIRDYFEHLP
ncbi:MAG TPA: Crp/Fnr family transcriptional regulator [Gemmataceae bacterium]|nr:Crp/Fnr family transcriptional regulator [Gemmataceae bacterium]